MLKRQSSDIAASGGCGKLYFTAQQILPVRTVYYIAVGDAAEKHHSAARYVTFFGFFQFLHYQTPFHLLEYEAAYI